MSAAVVSRRAFLQGAGALVVGFTVPSTAFAQRLPRADAALGKTVDAGEVDGFIAVNADGSVTIFSGKVDLGQGLRIAIPQMAAEELGVGLEHIRMLEGDTALTPDQGATGGSSGVMRGGVQIRQAAATAREALIALASSRMGRPAAELDIIDGEVRTKAGGSGIRIADLVGDKRFNLKVDAKAKLRDPASYRIVGKPIARPDIPAKVSGRHLYVHDLVVDGMLHGRVVRPPAVGASLVSVDEASVQSIPGVRVVRIKDFLAVVAADEWDAISAARLLRARWSDSSALLGSDGVRSWMKRGPFEADETLVKKGDAAKALADAKKVSAEFYWPVQSHASLGPSCAVADVREDRATVWSASQATHRFRETIAKALAMPRDAVRIVYLDGAGCYGMNGHDDAAADAALLSKAVGRPVRVQWSRQDEHGFDPKAPPQLLSLEGSVAEDGRIDAWRTQMWIPKATASLPNMPLLAIDAAGIAQTPGITMGLISQNGDPPYAAPHQEVVVHWLKGAPLRPSNFRAPGKVANCFAVESFTDMLAAAAQRDPVEFRLRGLADPRGIEVIRRAAALIKWQPRDAGASRTSGSGRGFAYIHYKHNESYVAIAMDVDVDKSTGAIRVRRVACAHDCGLVINPAALTAQIEGNILQTLSRTLMEEVAFDRSRVTSVDWASYPILRFPEAPEVLVDIVDRPREPPLGAGEAAATPVPAALANAVFDAVGVRLTSVPFTRDRVRAAVG
ncbi:MAG TPA: molybdopterin cofactor-binding domain-containing protein [Casimicrobiaceae bacterium]|nr:molybdopterin cofactor-binding domain-containing protein [Casimicrobiaceae bacterium]